MYFSMLLCLMGGTLFFANQAGCDPLSLIQMMAKLTDHSPLDYSRYGNFCGLGGGGEPLDQVDACCERHDACYDQIDKRCALLHGLLITYPWGVDASYGNVTCDVCKQNPIIIGRLNPLYVVCNCKREICKCDADLVMCLRDNEEHYNQSHVRNTPIAEPGFRF